MYAGSIGCDRNGRPTLLTCLECGARSDQEARGWRALIPYYSDEEQAPNLSLYCPSCAEREFGLPGSRPRLGHRAG